MCVDPGPDGRGLTPKDGMPAGRSGYCSAPVHVLAGDHIDPFVDGPGVRAAFLLTAEAPSLTRMPSRSVAACINYSSEPAHRELASDSRSDPTQCVESSPVSHPDWGNRPGDPRTAVPAMNRSSNRVRTRSALAGVQRVTRLRPGRREENRAGKAGRPGWRAAPRLRSGRTAGPAPDGARPVLCRG